MAPSAVAAPSVGFTAAISLWRVARGAARQMRDLGEGK